ncbi:MAG: hypothetical protein GY774_34265, partial [Planctomycetes bacterium]|nr:hypothetical protein [Planctomycetota bacterium]
MADNHWMKSDQDTLASLVTPAAYPTVMLKKINIQKTLILPLLCLALISTTSCRDKSEQTGQPNNKKIPNIENERLEMLTEAGKYKSRLDEVIIQLQNKHQIAFVSLIPDNLKDAVDYVEHSIHMRSPIYHCIEYREFYIMTDNNKQPKKPIDVLKQHETDFDESLIFIHGKKKKKGE